MIRLRKTTIGYLLFTTLLAACQKDAGPGGLATVKGKVYGRDITTGGNLKAEGYLPDWRVYISVSGDPGYFEDMKTSYDGSYEFKFLRKGNYDVWAFSDCDTCLIKTQLVMKKGIKVSDKKETVTVPDIEVIY
jgi:hypothetical protein